MSTWTYAIDEPGIGRLAMRPLALPEDLPIVHDWVRRDYARFWGLTHSTLEEVAQTYRAITSTSNVHVFLGHRNGVPAFLVECYRPFSSELAALYEANPGDRGMHVLLAPPRNPVHGFSRAVFRLILEYSFSDPDADRMVVEPDVRNTKIRALNRAHGFREVGTIAVPVTATAPGKTAMLSLCTRGDFERASAARTELRNV
ncbi:MAG: GNAT family N-acetyltransferase [Myxococcota bacterium]